MEIDQIDNLNTLKLYISLIAKEMEFWRMQSEMDYDYLGLRDLPFQAFNDELRRVSKYYFLCIYANFSESD